MRIDVDYVEFPPDGSPMRTHLKNEPTPEEFIEIVRRGIPYVLTIPDKKDATVEAPAMQGGS